ncbi:MAG: hypothetical protein A3A04_02595 [Candidatus Harrisonbacteria bacterium RIFCSPLOWO2_01_FULL_40_28]|uniref:Tagatose-bisphosphate aldolase n=2 Tax=Candidatus Harrisoniibacteriota TaxID=1817905 RepID=A0A1G1ZW62_9BACT|nr:MAG: hypothetical protein A3A04_02595 [Candidatus Harrisonbacteria bacterium RIFCSPLOWO2_01_FULL_40_28]OGY68913.1 MAG: hypothetical protein A2586_01860 [Candidatus Harrisonbacteria bacterium RIFOXYD1_FULL_40_9]
MHTLHSVIEENKTKGRAIGHFNFSTIDGLWALFRAAQELSLPLIVGTSEGERDFVGVRQAALLVKSIREQFNYPIFINADHTHSLDRVKEAVDAGYDAILFDGSALSFEENKEKTKEVVRYIRSKSSEIIIEGEIGYIGSASQVLDALPEGVSFDDAHLTSTEEAKDFIAYTGIDLFAPAVGNVHGMLKGGNEPQLNIKRIKDIAGACTVPLVLHGASGNTDEDVQAAISAGISIVHVNTELRVAWKKGIEMSLLEKKSEAAPYKLLEESVREIKALAVKKLRLYAGID